MSIYLNNKIAFNISILKYEIWKIIRADAMQSMV